MSETVRTEVRWAIHLPKSKWREEDFHYVKVARTTKDGKVIPDVVLLKNYNRPVWVHTTGRYKEKKEFELEKNLIKQECTESDLKLTVARLLGKPWTANQEEAIRTNPYIYGLETESTAFIKQKSLVKNKGIQSNYSVAAFDIETTTCAKKDILIATLSMKLGDTYYVYSGVTNEYLNRAVGLVGRVGKAIEKYIPKYKDNLVVDIQGFDGVVELLTWVFRKANELAPDFISIWNQAFDIPVCIDNIKRAGGDPKEVFCDPSVPKALKRVWFQKGVTKKVTASGVLKPLPPSAQWHKFHCTARYRVMDSMCVYKQLRLMEGEMPSYSLDAILNHELGSRKLKFSEADEYTGATWHNFMSTRYPVEYLVYNFYDTLSLLELDEKTNDLSRSLPVFSGSTDFFYFNSQSKKLTDALFWFGLERGKVIGTGGVFKEEDEIPDEALEDEDLDVEEKVEDYRTLDLKNWIMLLPQSLLVHDGLKLFEDVPNLVTNIRGLVSDVDSVSSYPSCTSACNVSKETTISEVIEVTDVPEEVFREHNLSLCLGKANTLEYFEVMFNLPSLDEVDTYLTQLP